MSLRAVSKKSNRPYMRLSDIFQCYLYLFFMTAILYFGTINSVAKNKRNLLSHSSGASNPKLRCQQKLVPLKPSVKLFSFSFLASGGCCQSSKFLG